MMIISIFSFSHIIYYCSPKRKSIFSVIFSFFFAGCKRFQFRPELTYYLDVLYSWLVCSHNCCGQTVCPSFPATDIISSHGLWMENKTRKASVFFGCIIEGELKEGGLLLGKLQLCSPFYLYCFFFILFQIFVCVILRWIILIDLHLNLPCKLKILFFLVPTFVCNWQWLVDGEKLYNALSYFLVSLTHSHTMTPFDAPGKQAFWKHSGKRRNCS